jgi:hypothetical protein
MKRLWSAWVVILILIAVLLGSLSYYFLTSQQIVNTVSPCANFFTSGHYAEYAGGSSTNCQFQIPRNGNLTGAFVANASLDFFIQTENQFGQNTLGTIPTDYYYGLVNVSSARLNVPLLTGSYYIEFYFTYRYPVVSPINATGYGGSTRLNTTETFVVKLV